MMAHGVDARGGGALRHHDHHARGGHRRHRLDVAPSDAREAEVGQAASHRADYGDAMSGEIPCRAGRYNACHSDQRRRKFRRKAAESDHACHDRGGKAETVQIHIRQSLEELD